MTPRVCAFSVVLAAALGCADAPAEPGPSDPVVAVAETAPELWSPPVPDGVDVPDGMVYVPGGTTTVGDNSGLPQERPAFTVEVAPFFMDRTPVTVADFRAFVEATDYETEAERLGNAGVFTVEAGWQLVDGATWHHPLGPDGPAAPDDHPVTQVSWHDAVAYADWAGKRLPTEVEREHAARNARNDATRYPWGDRLVDEDGRYRANVWQGVFPYENTGTDGHLLTSPVGAFGASPLGLADLGGNVWEWTADWLRPYADRGTPITPGPGSERVTRGGSFMCDGAVCHGYRVSARMGATPETALFHTGFRLVRDLDG